LGELEIDWDWFDDRGAAGDYLSDHMEWVTDQRAADELWEGVWFTVSFDCKPPSCQPLFQRGATRVQAGLSESKVEAFKGKLDKPNVVLHQILRWSSEQFDGMNPKKSQANGPAVTHVAPGLAKKKNLADRAAPKRTASRATTTKAPAKKAGNGVKALRQQNKRNGAQGAAVKVTATGTKTAMKAVRAAKRQPAKQSTKFTVDTRSPAQVLRDQRKQRNAK
jgi:hypothetical protein